MACQPVIDGEVVPALPVDAPAAMLFGMLPRRNDPLPLLASLGPIMLVSLLGAREVVNHADSRIPLLPTSEYLLRHARPGDAVWQDSMPRLLLETDQSIVDIAYVSGFTNLSNFNRRFKEQKGHSPRAYRNLMRAAEREPGDQAAGRRGRRDEHCAAGL